jgi:KEOPS complex subunit Cgi121
MVSDLKVIGIEGDAQFDAIVKHFTSMGGDVILMDPTYVYGEEMIESAVAHAERAFRLGENRSKTLLTEIIMYSAGERQISKALARMRPKKGQRKMVAVVINVPGDMRLEEIGMTRCDDAVKGTPEKAKAMGLENDMGIPPEELALELVALLDVAK